MSVEPRVYVVDDDSLARDSVCALAGSMGLTTESFTSAEEFLLRCETDVSGCLVTDLRMLGMSGLELQQSLRDKRITLPVIVITAYASTPLAVRAMQQGAVTLLEKPYENDQLSDAIREAMSKNEILQERRNRWEEIRDKLALLTDKEREVLDLMIAGLPNKVVASRLNVGLRTVESRRHKVFDTMRTNSVAELVQMVVDFKRGI